MAIQRFNYNETSGNEGNLPNGGAPIYANDIGMLDLRLTNNVRAILAGMIDFASVNFNLVGDQTEMATDYIISGGVGTITEVDEPTKEFNLAITAGTAYIDGDVVEFDAQNINYFYPEFQTFQRPHIRKVVLTKNTTNVNRVLNDASTQVMKLEFSASLSTDITLPGIPFDLNDGTETTVGITARNGVIVPRLVNMLTAFQAANEKVVRTDSVGFSTPITGWAFNDAANDRYLTKSNGMVHVGFRIQLTDLTRHNNRTTGNKRVWNFLTADRPAIAFAENYRTLVMSEKQSAPGDFLEDTVMTFNSTYICLEKLSGRSFEANETFYINHSFPTES